MPIVYSEARYTKSKQVQPREIPHTFFAEFYNDFKAEVIAAELVEHGIDADRILILMLGALKRPFSKDVETIEEDLSEYDHKEYVIVKTPREGIYDMLPEGLFHHPTAPKSATTEKEIIKTIKQRRNEERNARKFFLPFEATINFLRMQMALHENKLDKRSHYGDLVEVFSNEWEIFRYFDARQANIFLHLIPIIHDLRDDHPAIEQILEMMFLVPVQVELRSQLPIHPSDPIISKLGKSTVGIDLTTGNDFYDEGEDEIIVRFGPMHEDSLNEFIKLSSKRKILELLIDYLLPVHLDIVTEFILEEKEKTLRLADKETDLNSVLGADTYL